MALSTIWLVVSILFTILCGASLIAISKWIDDTKYRIRFMCYTIICAVVAGANLILYFLLECLEYADKVITLLPSSSAIVLCYC